LYAQAVLQRSVSHHRHRGSAATAKSCAAEVRGHLRSRSEGLNPEFTKPNTRKHRVNPGASALVCAGIIGCRVRLWHYLPQGRWNGESAANTYRGPIHKALKKYRGEKDEYLVLEDH